MKTYLIYTIILSTLFSCKKEPASEDLLPPIKLNNTKFTAEWYKQPNSAFWHYLVLNFVSENEVEYYEYFGIDDGKNSKVILNYSIDNTNTLTPKLKISGKSDKKIGDLLLNEVVKWDVDVNRNVQTKQTAYLEIGTYYYRR